MNKRRLNGDGSFRQRTQQCWEGRLRTEEGHINVYGKSKAEVRNKIDEIKSSIANDDYVEKDDTTVKEWLETWIACYVVKAKDSTRDRYHSDIRNHINPALGTIPIQELKRVTVQRFLVDLKTKKHLAEKSLKMCTWS